MRYRNVFSLTPNLYTPGCPVIIAAGALLADSQSNHMIAQLKLRNISDQLVLALKVVLLPADAFGQPVDTEIEYQYLDQCAPRNVYFASNCAILLPPATRSYRVRVTQVLLADNSIWKESGGEWTALEAVAILEDYFGDDEIAQQFRLTFPSGAKAPCRYYPIRQQDLWICTCGAVNHEHEAICCVCGRSFDQMTAPTTEELAEALRIRLEEEAAARKKLEEEREAARLKAEQEREEQRLRALAEQAEAQRRAAEEREKFEEEMRRVQVQQQLKAAERSRRTKKTLRIVIPILLAVILLAGGITFYVLKFWLPEKNYQEAVALYEAGDRAGAMVLFNELSDYKDVPEYIYDNNYENALAMIEDGNYHSALELLETMPDYRDAGAYLPYLRGWACLQDKRYTEALEIFSGMTDGDFSYGVVHDELLYEAMYLAAKDGDGITLEEALELMEQLPDDYEAKSVEGLQDNYNFWLRYAGTYVQMEDSLRYELNISFILRNGDVAPVVEYSFFNGTILEEATIKKTPSHIVEGTTFRTDCCITAEGTANNNTYLFRFYLNDGAVCITCPRLDSEYYAYREGT